MVVAVVMMMTAKSRIQMTTRIDEKIEVTVEILDSCPTIYQPTVATTQQTDSSQD